MTDVRGSRQTERASLISVLLTAVAITVNHVFTLGIGALLLGAVLLVLPAALWTWFRRTGRRTALASYLLMNAWIVLGFGLFKGLWDIALPVFMGTLMSSISTTYPRPVFGPLWFEISGIVMFIGSVFVLYYAAAMMSSIAGTISGWLPAEPSVSRPFSSRSP